jgi:cytoskeletal protein RodZ
LNSPLADIGVELRDERERQQRSLDDFAHLTLIHRRHLQAVEEGRDGDLPEPFYVKAFIRKYASALGLPGEAMANRYWDTRPLAATTARSASGPDLMVPWWVFPAMLGALLLGAFGTFAVMNARRSATPAVEPVAASPVVSVAADATAGAMATAGGTVGFEATPTASAPEGAAPTVSVAALPATAGAGVVALRPAETTAPAATASAAPVNLPPLVVPGHQITFRTTNKEAAWMRIVADGREIHAGIVPKGSTRTWIATRSLAVRIGRPGVVTARLGDRPLGALGPKDAPAFRRMFLTRDGQLELERLNTRRRRTPAPPLQPPPASDEPSATVTGASEDVPPDSGTEGSATASEE